MAGVSLLLLDEGGDRVDFALSDAGGRFRLSAPIPGVFRIVHERIGFEGDSTPAFRLERGQVLERRLLAATRPVVLPAISVVTRDRCQAGAGFDGPTADLWNEVRKALEIAEWTESRGRLVYTLRTWERRLHPRTLEVVHEETRLLEGSARSSPWLAEEPEELLRLGFMRALGDSVVYDGLDASTVLSDAFLDGHCYHPVPPPDGSPGWVGLAFEPDGSREIADVEGVLWVDRESAELRRLDYRYTNLPDPLRRHAAEGRVEFRRLRGGPWIVERWWIRMPILTRSGRPARPRVMEIEEDGGEVVRVEAAPGEGAPRILWSGPVDLADEAAPEPSHLLTGNVVPGGAYPGIYVVAVDAATGAGVRGVEVAIPRLSLRGRTNREGHVVFEGLRAGDYRLTVRHPRYLSAEAVVPAPRSGTRLVQALLSRAPRAP